jgi:hypothetical protein
LIPDPLADARAWYERAQEHIAEYRRLAYGEHERIWSLHSEHQTNGTFNYSLRFNCDLLVRLKPVACEAANALFQSLDNIIAVPARRVGELRNRNICWPWAIEKDPNSTLEHAVRPAIGKKICTLRKEGIPEQWLTLIEEVFASPAAGLIHIDVVKEVSLSGKHWELIATGAEALSVAWFDPASKGQVVVDIPHRHFEANDEYVFHEGDPISAPGFMMVIETKLVAPGKAFEPEPIAAFECTSRFVMTALKKAKELLAGASQ